MDIRNAKITKTMLGIEEHGILTCSLTLDYGSSFQSFGGYALDERIKIMHKFSHREGTKIGMIFIQKLMEVVGVRSWEELEGQHVRAKIDGFNSPVSSIGHFLKDKWFTPKELFDEN